MYIHKCKKPLVEIHLTMGYEALVAIAMATGYSFLLLRRGVTRSLLANKYH